MHASSLDVIVDTLCQQGCQQVAKTIQAIEAGQYPDIVQPLDASARDVVLRELKAVMAVYGDRSCDLPE